MSGLCLKHQSGKTLVFLLFFPHWSFYHLKFLGYSTFESGLLRLLRYLFLNNCRQTSLSEPPIFVTLFHLNQSSPGSALCSFWSGKNPHILCGQMPRQPMRVFVGDAKQLGVLWQRLRFGSHLSRPARVSVPFRRTQGRDFRYGSLEKTVEYAVDLVEIV